jgi:hypothetical protein
MVEFRNVYGRCIDKDSIDEMALHEVEFELKESGGDWQPHVVQIMAKDPMDAINAVRKEMTA